MAKESGGACWATDIGVREFEVRSDSIGKHFAFRAGARSGAVAEFAAIEASSACVVTNFAIVAVGASDEALESRSMVEHSIETASCARTFVSSIHTGDAVGCTEIALMGEDTRNELATWADNCTCVSCSYFIEGSRIRCSRTGQALSQSRTVTS